MRARKKIAIYHEKYLPLSETFIYRQIIGLSDFFTLKVFARSVENLEEYPGIDPVVVPQQNMFTRLLGRDDRYFKKQFSGIDLLHVNFGNIALRFDELAIKLDIPLTAFFLGYDASFKLNELRYCRKLQKSNFAAVFVNSEDMKVRLMPYLPVNTKVHVVYCGIPIDRFPFRQRSVMPSGATFLQISRLCAKKGLEYTLLAFKKYLTETDPQSRLVIAGDGPLKGKLLRLSDSLQLTNNVKFTGSVRYSEYIELMQTADAFIHPSITADDGDMEGIPTVICEAMACGLPVVATRHSGIPELIEDGVNGFLVEERNVDELHDKMSSLQFTDIGTMSVNARLKIENEFNHAATVSLLAAHLSSIIGK